ncbi:Homeodomain-like protein [Fomitopsis serialis]|uniref:Homeodomain-like protein n=1 Tax=Fomitopsis serialis TaxID=139415 RepID=UPI0020089C34|nr:Homeodomain-like protein [Neoantrodia serialis]KAH9918677.1 Homeodomain-like protein [Neoantrodia serialis]
MPQNVPTLTKDLCWVLIYMHYISQLSTKDISTLTGIRLRTLQRLFRLHLMTGDVATHRKRTGRKRKLDQNAEEFIQGLIEHSPDSYLMELRDRLQEIHGVQVDMSTIWRTLKKLGFTYKKACTSVLAMGMWIS